MSEKELKPVGMLVGDKWDKMHDISRRVYDEDGVCPTIPTGAGGNTEVKVLQRTNNATALKINTVGNYSPSKHNATRIISTDGIAPTVMHNHGSVTAIAVDGKSIGALRGRNPENPSDRTAGAPTVQMLEIRADQCTNTITSVQKDNVVIERDAETGAFPDDYIVIIDGKPCLVRKLTPKECWRLFGFTDEQFETAKKALEEKHYKGRDKASSQLYKQAGNTIVIPMLAAVLQAIKEIKAKEVQNG